ncbi:cytochrome P450 [Micromonospora sonneratiae]
MEQPALSRAVLTDDRFSSQTLGTAFRRFSNTAIHTECAHLLDILSRWYVQHDPPEHTERRRLSQGNLTRTALTALTPAIEAVVAEVLDALPEQGKADGVRDVAQPVSARVIALALGVPAIDPRLLHRWSTDIGRFLGAVYRLDYARAAQRAVEEMASFLEDALKTGATRGPGPVYRGTDARENLAAHTMMLFGGLETSGRLLTLGLWELLRAPDPGMVDVDGLLDAVLRDYPPLRYVSRVATRECVFDDQRIRAGDLLMVSLTGGAAAGAPVLAFGQGRHYCPGMQLTMIEANLVLSRFRERFPGAALSTPDVRPTAGAAYHGFDSLPLTLVPTPRAEDEDTT